MEQFDFKRRFVLKGLGAAGVGVAVAACGGGGGSSSSSSSNSSSSGGSGVVPNPGNATQGGSAATCSSSGFRVPLIVDASVTATGIPADIKIYAYITGLVPQANGSDIYYRYANNVNGGHSVQQMSLADNSQAACNGSNTVCGLTGAVGQANYPTAWADYSIELDRTCATVLADLADFDNLPNIGTGNNAFSGRIWISVGTPKIPFAVTANGYTTPNYLVNQGVGACQIFCVNGVSVVNGESIAELNGKTSQRRFPVADRHRPFLADVA